MGNIAKVISTLDDYDNVAMDHILKRLHRKAQGSSLDNQLYQYVLKGLSYLQLVPLSKLPKTFDESLNQSLTIQIAGEILTKNFKLVKVLNRENIYEFRISLDQVYFRAIFFPLTHEEQLYYCFVFGYSKPIDIQGQNDPLTNTFRDRASIVYKRALENPGKYILV